MPTIQLKFTDDELSNLLSLTNHTTASKTIRWIIEEYVQLLDERFNVASSLNEARSLNVKYEDFILASHTASSNQASMAASIISRNESS